MMNIYPPAEDNKQRIKCPFFQLDKPINNKQKIDDDQRGICQTEESDEVKIFGAHMWGKVRNQ